MASNRKKRYGHGDRRRSGCKKAPAQQSPTPAPPKHDSPLQVEVESQAPIGIASNSSPAAQDPAASSRSSHGPSLASILTVVLSARHNRAGSKKASAQRSSTPSNRSRILSANGHRHLLLDHCSKICRFIKLLPWPLPRVHIDRPTLRPLELLPSSVLIEAHRTNFSL